MEANHNLNLTGNIFTEDGSVPVVSTLGTFQVNVKYTVPVQAQGISTSGTSGPTAEQIAEAVWAKQVSTLTDKSTVGGFLTKLVLTVPKFLGLK
jgi:hypothetical protein